METDLFSCLIFLFRVNVTEDGMKALVTLANGDMRKALNILQVGFNSKYMYSGNSFNRTRLFPVNIFGLTSFLDH